MNKKLIRLTENDLHRIVKESVNRVLKESESDSTNCFLDDFLKNSIQKAIFSLVAVVSEIGEESKNFVYDGYSKVITSGEEHLKYHEVYELCIKTIKALQTIQK